MIETTTTSVAAKLRREMLHHTESKLNAKTKQEQAEQRGIVYGLAQALELLVQADNAPPGIAPKVGSTNDVRAMAEVERFLGDNGARRLGFTRE